MVGYQRWCRPSDPSEHLLTSSIVAVSVSAAAVHYIHWFLHILLAKMSDSNRKKRHRKKSFLHKLSRAFAGKPKKNNDESESSDDELKGETSSSHETSPEKSSATCNSTSPSSKQLVQVHNIISPENIDKVGAPLKLLPPSGQHENPDKGLSISDVKNAVDNSAHEGAVAPSRPPRNKGIPAAQGSDRHLTAKTNFISVSPTITSQSERIKNSCVDNSEIFDVSEGLKVVTTTSANELLKTPTLSEDLTQKLIRKERKYHSDSDESDTTEYSSEDENLDLIESEISKQSMEDLYFTTGKYISYFFLEMERQNYDPNKEVYRVIHYHDTSEQSMKKGDQSSSDSASPGIHMQMRNKLLHRGSADNLIINSQANFMQHSSPESVKSAPIRLKSRSTSHDALARRKERQFALTEGASMDNLAKQSLLAAQVLNLIPTQKARERNFLHGRIAANSLLGPVELEKVLPNREVKIFVGTWNMNGQTPPKELNDFMLPSEIQTIPDILAIGTQESCSERGEWEAALQETLGPSHVLLTSTSLGTLHLALFLRRELIWFCSVPEESSFSTRPGTAFRTKGAVALALMLFGTSFLFVTAHLTAHQDKVKERVSDIKRIIRNLDLPKDLPTKHKNKDVTQNFDCVFWCGDLNFRLAQPREEVIQWVSNMCFPQPTPISLAKDQLRMTLNEGAVLRGFEEGPITFPPTYKYDSGTQNFDTSSKQRTPAYTDRILFKGKGHTRGYIRRVSHESNNSQKDGNIECLVYDSVPSICTSDHKPVWGVFKTTVRPGIDTIPLAAGLFNREIYLEGIKRRAAAMDDSYGTSKVCSLQ